MALLNRKGRLAAISLILVLAAGIIGILVSNETPGRYFSTVINSSNGRTSKWLGSTSSIQGVSGRAHRLQKSRVYKGQRIIQFAESCESFSKRPGRNCEQWVVVTTINNATAILKSISRLKGWCMVVVGDKKGPISIDLPNVDFLNVRKQESCGYHICRLTPWNHFGRKNIGYLYAIEHGAKVIYDTDDDNKPLFDHVAGFTNISYSNFVQVQGHLWNPYPVFGPDASIWPRGFPLNFINNDSTKTVKLSVKAEDDSVGVVQYLAQHDPDVDAIYRLTQKMPYDFNTRLRRLVVPQRVLVPYNAQATLHAREAFWGMLLPITVHGRVSDIWRSYSTQRMLWDVGKHLAFHSPFVVQYRNVHNYMADFDSEMDLYYKAGGIVDLLLRWVPNPSSSLLQRLLDLQIELYEYGFLEINDVAMMEAWIQDLQCLGYHFPAIKSHA